VIRSYALLVCSSTSNACRCPLVPICWHFQFPRHMGARTTTTSGLLEPRGPSCVRMAPIGALFGGKIFTDPVWLARFPSVRSHWRTLWSYSWTSLIRLHGSLLSHPPLGPNLCFFCTDIRSAYPLPELAALCHYRALPLIRRQEQHQPVGRCAQYHGALIVEVCALGAIYPHQRPLLHASILGDSATRASSSP